MVSVVLVAAFVVLIVFSDGLAVIEVVMVDGVVVAVVLWTLIGDAIVAVVEFFIAFSDVSVIAVVVD